MAARALLLAACLVALATGCLHVTLTDSGPALSVPIETPPPLHSDGGAAP